MRLIKINYGLALFVGVFAFVVYFAIGVLQWVSWGSLIENGLASGSFDWLSYLILSPLVISLVVAVVVAVSVTVYNFMAKFYPIAWEVSRK